MVHVVTAWAAGSLIVQLTPPAGCKAPEIPMTVAVRLIVPPTVGGDAVTTVITGVAWAKVKVKEAGVLTVVV